MRITGVLFGMLPKDLDEVLKDLERGKCVIQFAPGKPKPVAVVRAMVNAEVKELELVRATGIMKK